MKSKNTICLWFNKDAQEAARFYAATFPNSEVTAVHQAPSDYPSGKKGDVLTVEFTVMGIPVSVSMVDDFKPARPFPFRSRPTIRKKRTVIGTRSSAMAVRKVSAAVQGSLGPLLANHPARAHGRACGRWR